MKNLEKTKLQIVRKLWKKAKLNLNQEDKQTPEITLQINEWDFHLLSKDKALRVTDIFRNWI